MVGLATFDTHKHIKELTSSGFNEKWAEVTIKSILEGRDYDVSKLATKEELIKAEAKLERQIVAINERLVNLDNKIDTTKQELKKDIESNSQELKKEIALKISESQNKVLMYMLSLFSPIYIGILFFLIRWLFIQG